MDFTCISLISVKAVYLHNSPKDFSHLAGAVIDMEGQILTKQLLGFEVFFSNNPSV